jgi:hypothetical protein
VRLAPAEGPTTIGRERRIDAFRFSPPTFNLKSIARRLEDEHRSEIRGTEEPASVIARDLDRFGAGFARLQKISHFVEQGRLIGPRLQFGYRTPERFGLVFET